MKNKPMILQLTTFPSSSLGLVGFRKEVLRIGHYVKESTNQVFDITSKVLDDLVATFDKWVVGGNKVPIPLGHERAHLPEYNRGWVKSLVREGDSLYGILELSDPDLALTTDVSVCIENKVTDGNGIKYKNVLTHIALTCEPVVGKLNNFMKLSLVGESDMEILKKIGKALGLKSEESTEELVLSTLTEKIKPAEKKVELSQASAQVIDPVVKLVSENRALKLSNLVKAGLITPATSDVITAKYVETKVLALSMESKQEDGFDLLYTVLSTNKPVKLDEVTGVQNLELANLSAAKPNVMQQEVSKRRKAAGLEA